MDELLPKFLAFPQLPQPDPNITDAEYDRQIRNLVQLLNQTPASIFIGGVAGGGDLFEILDPSINTLPYLRTLLACIEDVQNDKRPASPDAPSFSPGSNLWQKMLIFIEAFDPVQVRYAGHDWRRLLETVARSAEKVSQPSSAIQPIETALLRLDATSSCFTSVHLVFVRLCLKAKAHVPALTILNNDILFFPSVSEKSHYIPLPCSHHEMSSSYITKSSGLSDTLFHRDHLLYFLYGAMTYIQLKNWSRAQLFLEFVIMSPIFNSVSMIQVEAYKKWVLVSLISNGRLLPLPRTANPQATRQYRILARPYVVLADVFQEGNFVALFDEFDAARHVFQNDCNAGLARHVLKASRRYMIIKLSKTYIALPISDITRYISGYPPDQIVTETYLSSLITTGQLNATIAPPMDSSRSSILRFAASPSEGPLVPTEANKHENLAKSTSDMVKMANNIETVERMLELSKEYTDYARREARRQKENSGTRVQGLPPQMTTSNYYGGVDEEMLADL